MIVETASLRWPNDVHALSYPLLELEAFGAAVVFGTAKSAMVWYAGISKEEELGATFGFGMMVRIREGALAMSSTRKSEMNIATQLWHIKKIFVCAGESQFFPCYKYQYNNLTVGVCEFRMPPPPADFVQTVENNVS